MTVAILASGSERALAMRRERVHYINTGPWPGYIGFTTSKSAYDREMKRLKVEEPNGFTKNGHSHACTHFLDNHGSDLAIICIEPFTKRRTKEQYAALIAHEAVHVIQQMRHDLGELGSEAEAYLVQQIVQECLQIAWATNRAVRKAPVA